ARGLDGAREIDTEDGGPRPPKTVQETDDERPLANDPVAIADRGGVHTYKNFVVLRDRQRHVADCEHLRRTVAGDDGGLQATAHTPSRSMKFQRAHIVC